MHVIYVQLFTYIYASQAQLHFSFNLLSPCTHVQLISRSRLVMGFTFAYRIMGLASIISNLTYISNALMPPCHLKVHGLQNGPSNDNVQLLFLMPKTHSIDCMLTPPSFHGLGLSLGLELIAKLTTTMGC